jgi:hypothetical protein
MSSHLQGSSQNAGRRRTDAPGYPFGSPKAGCGRGPQDVLVVVALSALRCGGRGDPSPIGLGKLKLKGYPYPFFFRHGASDVRVIRQIFLKEQYGQLKGEENVGRIINCEANIGCSAVYFLSKYPDAELIAIEPDEDNCRILRKTWSPLENGLGSSPCFGAGRPRASPLGRSAAAPAFSRRASSRGANAR